MVEVLDSFSVLLPANSESMSVAANYRPGNTTESWVHLELLY